KPSLDAEPFTMDFQIGVQPQIRRIVSEEDRGTALMLPELHGLRDATVNDALQHLILTPRGPLHRLPPLLDGLLLGEVDADPTLIAHRPRVLGETVLPRRPRVQHLVGEHPVITEMQARRRSPNAALLQQLRQPL